MAMIKDLQLRRWEPAAHPAERTPVGNGGQLCNDSKPNLKHRDLRPVLGKGKLHGEKEEVVETDEEEGDQPHREEEEGGGVGDQGPELSVLHDLIVDYYTSDPEECRDCKEGDMFEGQQELLQKGLVLHQIFRLVREVNFSIDFPYDQQ